MGALTNSVHTDEKPQNPVSYQDLHFLIDKIIFKDRNSLSFALFGNSN